MFARNKLAVSQFSCCLCRHAVYDKVCETDTMITYLHNGLANTEFSLHTLHNVVYRGIQTQHRQGFTPIDKLIIR